MKSVRYWIYGLILIIVLLLLVWAACFRFLGSQTALFHAVPPTSSMVAGWKDGAAFLRLPDSTAFEAALPQSLRRDLALFREVLSLTDTSGLGPVLFFMQEDGPEGAALGAIFDTRGSQLNMAALQEEVAGLRQTEYRGYKISTLAMASGANLIAARHRNLLVIGRFPFLVEEVIGNLSATNARASISGRAAVFAGSRTNIWVGGEALNKRWPGAADYWPEGWLRLGVNTGDDGWSIEGTYFPDQGEVFPWLRETREARPGPMLQLIPEDIAWLSWMPAGSPGDLWARGEQEGNLLREYFAPLSGAEQALAATRLHGSAAGADRFWILHLEDAGAGALALEELSRRVGVLEDYEYQTYRIRRLLSDQLLPPVSGPPVSAFDNPYAVILGAYLLLATSRSALELWIDQYLVGATLPSSSSFLTFYQQNDFPARTWWLARPPMLSGFLEEGPLGQALTAALRPFPFVGLQWRSNVVTPELSGNWPATQRPATMTPAFVWRTRLEAPLLGAPAQIQVPGLNTPFFIMQDENYQLYLLDSEGNIRWQEAMTGPVLSDFHLINFYGNSQRQLLFNTAEAVHLLDLERGGTAGNFPLELQSEARNGVTVIDTTGSGGYAFFLACRNERIYGYNREGIPLPGWNPSDSVGVVTHPVLHFQETGKDYFVALNEQGVLHVLKRNGEDRFPPKVFNDTFPSPPAYQLHPRSSRIVVCNQDGVVQVVTLTGEHFPLPLRDAASRPVYFAFADLMGDDRKDYLSLSGNTLTAHYYRGNTFHRAFRYRFDRRPDELFAVSAPGREKAYAGLLDAGSRKIYLLDGAGKLHPGFPLAGSTPFCIADLYGNGESSVIVGEGTSVYAYSVELNW